MSGRVRLRSGRVWCFRKLTQVVGDSSAHERVAFKLEDLKIIRRETSIKIYFFEIRVCGAGAEW